MFKNVASQKIALFAFDTTTGAAKTGDSANLTAYVSKDSGTVTILGDTSATEMDSTNAKGWYLFDLTQAETNADILLFTAKSSTANIAIVGQYMATLPPLFTTMSVDSTGSVKIQTVSKKNQALAKFEFLMTDSTTHNPATGKTVTVTRSIDGAAFGSGTLSAVTEVSNGIYYVDFAAADLNGNVVTLRVTASGCDDLFVTFVLEP